MIKVSTWVFKVVNKSGKFEKLFSKFDLTSFIIKLTEVSILLKIFKGKKLVSISFKGITILLKNSSFLVFNVFW